MSYDAAGASGPGETVRVLQRQVALVDPHVCTDDRDKLSILFSIYDGLVRRGPGSHYQPGLAESWSVTDDARNWTFMLRADATFHDGSRLRASDVVASLERVRDPTMEGELGTQGVYRSYLQDATFERMGETEVRIDLGRPMADLLDLIVDVPIALAKNLGDPIGTPIGSGPYRLSERSDSVVLLEAFDSHWAGTPRWRRCSWRAEPNVDRRREALSTSAVDIAADMDAGSGIGPSEARFLSLPSSVCTAFMCNLKGGVTKSTAIRRALNHALDVPALIAEVLPGQAAPLNGPLTSRHLGHDPELPAFRYDPGEALRLLKEAGHVQGITLELDVPTRLPDEAIAVANAMAKQYRNVGVETVVHQHTDRDAYARLVRDGQLHDAACFDSSPLSTYRVLREKFHSGHRGPWWLGYSNSQVDALIDHGQETVDVAARRRIYRQAYRLISNDAPWIFLYNQQLYWGVGTRVPGWAPTGDGRISLT